MGLAGRGDLEGLSALWPLPWALCFLSAVPCCPLPGQAPLLCFPALDRKHKPKEASPPVSCRSWALHLSNEKVTKRGKKQWYSTSSLPLAASHLRAPGELSPAGLVYRERELRLGQAVNSGFVGTGFPALLPQRGAAQGEKAAAGQW